MWILRDQCGGYIDVDDQLMNKFAIEQGFNAREIQLRVKLNIYKKTGENVFAEGELEELDQYL